MNAKIKLDVNRLVKDELIYELKVRGLGDGNNLTVNELRTVLRNAIQLEKTTLAIKAPPYPFTFAEDSESLTSSITNINRLVEEFSGIEGDSKFKGITSKIAHSLGRVNKSVPHSETEKSQKAEIRLKLLLAFDKLKDKVKLSRRNRDSCVFDLTVLRQNVDQPGAHSSAVESDAESSEEEMIRKIKPVPVRDWGLKFTGKKGDMSFSTFIERVDGMRRSRGVSRAMLFRDAADLLESDAYVWYNMVKDWATDWDSLVELMREQFLPENFDRDLFDEIKRRSQGDHESIGLYIASMKGLFNKMRQPVSEEIQLEIILERIDPYYQPFLAFETITSITQLLVACRKLDAKREIAKSFKPPPPRGRSLIPELAYASTSDNLASSSRASTSRVSEISRTDDNRSENRSISIKTCWNCGRSGHLSARCTDPRKLFCYSCGHPDVTVRSCPKCRRQGNGRGGRQ